VVLFILVLLVRFEDHVRVFLDSPFRPPYVCVTAFRNERVKETPIYSDIFTIRMNIIP